MDAVLDTNVVVSAILYPSRGPALVLNAFQTGLIGLVVDCRILTEYRTVLKRPKFGLSPKVVDALVDDLAALAQIVVATPLPVDLPIRDPGDIPFIGCALAAHCPVVTGNGRHFSGIPGLRVLSPAEILALLNLRAP